MVEAGTGRAWYSPCACQYTFFDKQVRSCNKMQASKILVLCVVIAFAVFSTILYTGKVSINFNVDNGTNVALADTLNTQANLIIFPQNYIQGKWNARLDSADATIDTVLFFQEDTSGGLAPQIIFNGKQYNKYTGQIIIYNTDGDDTLLFKLPGDNEAWVPVYPNGSSISLSPAFHDTIFTKSAGTDTVEFRYLFTEARIIQ
jgi:hypothetical protein